MHINEVERILMDSIERKEKQYEVKRYCDHVCCESDFVLLYNGMEFAYVKFDEKGNMKKKQMNIHEEKMGTASFYIVIKDSDEFIPTDLPCKVYPRNDMNSVFECTTDNLLQKLCDYHSTPYTPLNLEKVAEFFENTYSSLIRGRMQAFMSKIREETNLTDVIEDHGTYFMLSPKYERLFFCSLLGSTSGTPKRVCRYTSLSSLFRMLSETRQSMCSTICMNDKTENDYSIKYLSNAVPLSNVIQRIEARSPKTDAQSMCFILSGSRMGKKDDLNMWRHYGDDSKGVCLWYEIEDMPDNFFLSRVSYAKNETHAELTYLTSKMDKAVCGRSFEVRNLNSWLHFFKPAEYAIEEEIRLLYEMPDVNMLESLHGKWILNSENGIIAPVVSFSVDKKNCQFPLVLSRIVLGPNLLERNINKEQLRLMIKNKQIRITDDFEIAFSTIESYRK